MSSRWALVAVATVLGLALLALVVVLTPWRPLGGVAIEAAQPMLDFTKQQIAREDAYHSAVRPPGYASLVVSLMVALALGLTPLGARVVERAAAPLGGGWVWQVLLGAVALTLVGRALTLPWDAWAESVRRRYGLSTRSWGGWVADVAKGYGVGLVLTMVVLLVVVGLARWSSQWWWALGAAIGAVLVAVVSFAYPVVVEPVFNKFE
ncbi:MAG: M48 family peptidase, partial [Sporichthyaceae bacterium]|nr:M48 family peptidase [Sporichthyaceae bacterium]